MKHHQDAPIPTLSIIMPVFNEKPTIEAILAKVLDSPFTSEIIIVDDYSSDGTRKILEKLHNPKINIYYHDKNQGKGAAISTALKHAKSEYILIQDADLEYDPEEYIKLLKPVMEGKSIVVYGSRFTGEHRNMLFWHWLGNHFLSLVTNVLYNTTLSDMETCYKLIKRDIIKDIKLRSKRFDFEPEVTAKILKRKIRIYEVPISYAGREFDEGKKITWRDGIVALWTLVKYRFYD
jgi:glycosyltransferase involved in cell wall biosynthesis